MQIGAIFHSSARGSCRRHLKPFRVEFHLAALAHARYNLISFFISSSDASCHVIAAAVAVDQSSFVDFSFVS
jgi:nucleoside-diphosphate-sugar epimerase